MTVYTYFDINVFRFSLQIFYEQGFTALMFFIAFALGIGLVIGAVCLFLMIKRKRAVQSKSFTQVVIQILSDETHKCYIFKCVMNRDSFRAYGKIIEI